MALMVAGIFFALSTFVFRDEVIHVDRWQQATKIHYQMNGVSLFDRERYQEAISELKLCVAIAPNFSPAYNLMGKSYAILGEFNQAIFNFHKVIELTPEVPDGYKNLGLVYAVTGDRSNAAKWLSKASSLNPNDDSVKQELIRYGPGGNEP